MKILLWKTIYQSYMKSAVEKLLGYLDQQGTYEKILWNNYKSISNPSWGIPVVRLDFDCTTYIINVRWGSI